MKKLEKWLKMGTGEVNTDDLQEWPLLLRVELPMQKAMHAAHLRRQVRLMLRFIYPRPQPVDVHVSTLSQSYSFELAIRYSEAGWLVQWMLALCPSELGAFPTVIETRVRTEKRAE